MLCQNCGRRSSDTKSFCQHCGALAGEDSTAAVRPRVSQTVVSKRSQPAVRKSASSSSSTVRRAGSQPARTGSNPIGTLIFWGLVVYGGYWLLSDGRDLRSLVEDLLQQRQEPPISQPAPVAPRTSAPATRPPVPGTAKPVPPAAPVERQTEPAAPRPAAVPPSGTPARSSVPPIQPATPFATDPGIEGLSPAQVIQKLGRPASVVSVDGVTGWSYRDGALIVYFVKDRATLKPPR